MYALPFERAFPINLVILRQTKALQLRYGGWGTAGRCMCVLGGFVEVSAGLLPPSKGNPATIKICEVGLQIKCSFSLAE